MKRLYIILLMCLGTATLYSNALDTDSLSDYLSEEDCMLLDSLFAISNSFEPTNQDSVRKTIRRRQQVQNAIDFSYQTKYYITQNSTIASGMGRILVLCDATIYSTLSHEIIRYAKDIHNAFGCVVMVYSLTGGTPYNIKQLIKEHYNPNILSNLSGVVFVGDIAEAYFHTDAYAIGDWDEENFPCDYYYMDLDGAWIDNDNDAIPDTHQFNTEPEIFVGRICAKQFGSNQIQVLREYFNKNHRYWIGETPIKKQRALSCTYKDWTGFTVFKNAIKRMYGADYTDNMQGQQFTKQNYLNAIENRTYEFIQFACHSNVSHHAVIPNDTTYFNYIFTAELDSLYIQTLGYNLFCCKACNWMCYATPTIPVQCLGETYLYSPYSETLVVVGSSKSGGMWGYKHFYEGLGQGECIGNAYRTWWKDFASTTVWYTNQRRYRWFYGMCILGDPMINFLYDNQCNEEVNIPSWNQNNTSDKHIYYAQEEIAASCTIPHNKTLELHANSIRLTDGFHAPASSNLHISIEACYDNSVSPQKINKRTETTTAEAAVESSTNTAGIQVYPNPCSTVISINGATENKIRYKIYDMNGTLANSGFNNGQNIDVSTLPAGLYNLIIEDAHGNIKANGLKIIKQ